MGSYLALRRRLSFTESQYSAAHASAVSGSTLGPALSTVTV